MVFDLFPAAGLLLLLPFLLTQDGVWKNCQLRLVVVSPRARPARKPYRRDTPSPRPQRP